MAKNYRPNTDRVEVSFRSNRREDSFFFGIGGYHFHKKVTFKTVPSFRKRTAEFQWQLGWKAAEAYSLGYEEFLNGKEKIDNPFLETKDGERPYYYDIQEKFWIKGWNASRTVHECYEV